MAYFPNTQSNDLINWEIKGVGKKDTIKETEATQTLAIEVKWLC